MDGSKQYAPSRNAARVAAAARSSSQPEKPIKQGIYIMITMNQTLNFLNYRDVAGVSASLLCVLHCLATPFLITMLPVLAATEHQTHSVFAVVILSLGMLAFVPGYRKHRNKTIPAAGAAGVAMIIAAAVLPEMESGETIETLMVIAGGLTLIGAHLCNAYWCQFCRSCSENSCSLIRKREHTPAIVD